MYPRLIELMDLLPEAQSRFDAARTLHAQLRAQSVRQTARDEWFDGAHYAPGPLGLQRLGLTPARRLHRAPGADERANTCRYGLRGDGRICVEQQFTEFPDRAYEEFWDHADDRILTTRYDYYEPDKDLINVQILLLEPFGEDPRPAALVRYAQHGVALEAYEYDDAPPHRLRRVHAAACEHDPASSLHQWMSTIDDVHYDPAGPLARIDRSWSAGSRETIYPDAHDADRPG